MTVQLFANALRLESASWIRFQEKLFNSQLSRLEITELIRNLDTQQIQTIQVRVWRNYACEPMENIVHMVGGYWNIAFKFTFMGYDDSFSFLDISPDDDSYNIELLLVDTSHYQLEEPELREWLDVRAEYLSSITSSPVLCVTLGEHIDFRVGGKLVSSLSSTDQAGFYDDRYEKSTGSRLNPKTHYLLGRELAATWLPERTVPPKKLLAIDLDFTLHAGVLGEDGLRVVVNDEYKKLQNEILEARERGLMLAVISKNDRQDVLTLLQEHSEYLLRESDFVAIEASWGSKSEAMVRVLELTRIHQDAVIFIDDNPVELMQMAAAFPGITCVSVDAGPDIACKVLNSVPGFRRSVEDHASDVRAKDLQSNEDRERLISNGLTTYYETAQPVLKVSVRQNGDLERLIDLGKRSNQFNLLMARNEMVAYTARESTWVALSLEDRFSDSGIIGGILCVKGADDSCKVIDLFLSCRVLGRGLETSLICTGLMEAAKQLLCHSLHLSWIIGERNQPALTWLSEQLLESQIDREGSITMTREEIEKLSHPPTGVKVEITR